MKRPKLDAWLEDTAWVTGDWSVSPDAMRSRPEPPPKDVQPVAVGPVNQRLDQMRLDQMRAESGVHPPGRYEWRASLAVTDPCHLHPEDETRVIIGPGVPAGVVVGEVTPGGYRMYQTEPLPEGHRWVRFSIHRDASGDVRNYSSPGWTPSAQVVATTRVNLYSSPDGVNYTPLRWEDEVAAPRTTGPGDWAHRLAGRTCPRHGEALRSGQCRRCQREATRHHGGRF